MFVVWGDLEEAMWLERIRVVPFRARRMRRMWVSFWGRLAMVNGFRRRRFWEGRER